MFKIYFLLQGTEEVRFNQNIALKSKIKNFQNVCI